MLIFGAALPLPRPGHRGQFRGRGRRGEDRPAVMEPAHTRGRTVLQHASPTFACQEPETRKSLIPHQDADRGENFLRFSAMRCPQTSFNPELEGDRRTATSVR
jgi:hypothetical protein